MAAVNEHVTLELIIERMHTSLGFTPLSQYHTDVVFSYLGEHSMSVDDGVTFHYFEQFRVVDTDWVYARSRRGPIVSIWHMPIVTQNKPPKLLAHINKGDN